jgi:uncharacterized DUF497 family protein
VIELEWDWQNEEHISGHRVQPYEVEEACSGRIFVLRARGRNRYAIYGQTLGGRFLVVFADRLKYGSYYPVTARDMEDWEIRRYRQMGGGRRS